MAIVFFESNGLKIGMRVHGGFGSFVRAEREVGICDGVLRGAERILPMSFLLAPSVRVVSPPALSF